MNRTDAAACSNGQLRLGEGDFNNLLERIMEFIAASTFELVSVLYVLGEDKTKGFDESNRCDIPRVDCGIEPDNAVRFAKSGEQSA
jgi:hypothetical protein